MVSCLLLAVAALMFPGGAPRLPGAAWPSAPGALDGPLHGPPGPGFVVPRAGRRRVLVRRLPVGSRSPVAGGDRLMRAAPLLAAVLLIPVLLLAGPAGSLAAAMLLLTVTLLVRRAVAARRRRRALIDVVAALRMLGRELRAGADPGAAADRALATARGESAGVLTSLAQLARGGDRAGGAAVGLVTTPAVVDPAIAALSRLTGAWRLTTRYGVALAPLVDSLARDLAEQMAAQEQRAGQVAGPRTSGYVMAALPLLGLILGTGMGAEPGRVLLGSSLGNILLLVGVTLICLGLLWAARIVDP